MAATEFYLSFSSSFLDHLETIMAAFAEIVVTPTVDPFAAFGVFETPEPVALEVKDVSGIIDNTVFLKVQFGVLGNTRKVAGAEVLETDADKALLRVSKKLLDSQELAEITRKDMGMRKWLENMCLPYDIGLSLLPVGLVEPVYDKLKAYREERAELITAFVAAYPALCENAALHLGSLYNPGDYPSVSEITAKFHFTWMFRSFSVPGSLKGINPAIFEQQKEEAAKQFEEAITEIQAVMRQTLHELVSHLADRLAPGDEGKPKRLHAVAITNLQEFLSTFNFRNITNDTELAAQVEKARALVSGVDVDGLRKSDKFRANLQAGMQSITDRLSSMVDVKAGRKFRDE